jgi:regulation of enolase protein 1 (concanavalin A-like superfamily)
VGATDDFSTTQLHDRWRIEGPAGIGSGLSSDTSDAWLELVTPDGDHDPWNANRSARAMQDMADEDFTLETRFLSKPATAAQTQGILVEQDATNWIRFDVYSDGTDLHVFAAVTVNGQSSARIDFVIPEGAGEYIRVARSGSIWTFDYSADGETWLSGGSFSHALGVTAAGVFAGNSGQAKGHTARVDYFEVSTDPMTVEDGAPFTSDFATTEPVTTEGPFSDDFSAGTLDGGWRTEGPGGISFATGADGSDAWLELVTPDGNYDIWNANNAARLMQDAPDEDFTLATRFLSTPSARYQMQGLLVEQDAANWIRFDTYSDGNALRVFAAVTVNGSSSVRINGVIPPGSAPFLQVVRAGDTWSFRISSDGETWTSAGSFTHALTVSATGVYAGNSAGATGYTARVDFFETSLAPLTVEDGTPLGVNAAPDAADDALTAVSGVATVIDTADLLANDSDADNDTLTVTGFTQPAQGTLTDNGDGTWTYVPAGGHTGPDSFTYTISDGTDTDSATVTLSVTPPPAPNEAFSDDFNDATLDPKWRIEGPATISTALANDGTEHWLALVTPDGNHDIWNANYTARAMQDTADTDFTLATRFLSQPTQRYQMQGILVEQDATNWIRFDTYSDGSVLRAFAAVTVNGSSGTRISAVIPAGTAPYLEILRSGDTWTMRYSTDGEAWTVAGSFTHAIEVTASGVFAGNTAGATGFTALVDYFETSLDPLGSEDGVSPPPDAIDDAFVLNADTPFLITAADLQGNDLDPDGATVTIVSVSAPQHGTLTDNGDGTWTYLSDSGYHGLDFFTYTVSDGTTQDTARVDLTVGTPPPPAFVSDDFHDGPLGVQWSLVEPAGASHALGTEGIDSYLSLSTGTGNHDIWHSNNSVRAMQEVADENFTLEARFLSLPTQRYQMQGFLIEADPDNWLRFDIYSDGARLYAFGASTVNGASSQAFRSGIGEGTAAYLRLTRSGDVFTFAYSEDGETWVTAGSLSRAMVVAQSGVFAASAGGAGGFEARVDYVQIDSDPIQSEDGVTAPPDAVDDAFSTPADAALVLSLADLTANDVEPDGDPLTLVSTTAPAHGTLTDNGDGTWTYSPAAGFNGYDSFTYTVSDGTSQDTATVTLTIGTPPLPALIPDDFHAASLSGDWTVVNPQGATLSMGGDADDAFLRIATQGGNYDLWGTTRNASRIMQEVTDEDFVYEARFLSKPVLGHQMQGFLIEEDDRNWIRFDMYSNGGGLYAFAALTVNGSSSVIARVAISEDVEYLRVARSGDTFTFLYSTDGTSWSTAGTTTTPLEITKAGLFAGSVGASSGLEMRVDYVQTAADPLLDEDLGYEPPPAPPVTVADAFKMDPGSVLAFTAEDLLGNDSDINRDPLTIVGFQGLDNGTIADLGGGTYSYTPDPGFEGTESFSYTVSDGTFTATGSVTILVDLFDALSDDFSGTALDPAWTFEGIAGSAAIGYEGTEAFAMIHSPAGVQVSASGNMTTPRIMQQVLDLDFQISAGFLTEPTDQYQEHGLLVVQDDGNWLRFDLAYTGNNLTLIVGDIDDHATSYPLFKSMGSGKVEEFRITREGNLFTFEYRGGTSDWIVAKTLEREMTVTQVGAFAGSTSFTGPVPGYTAYLDYFENSLSPIVGEDSSYVPQNHAPVAADDVLGVPDSVTFTHADLLANDYDPDVGDTITVTSIGSVSHGTLTDNGDGSWTYTPFQGFQGIDSFGYTISDGTFSDSAVVELDVQKPIDLWHGEVQAFGAPGEGQRWINILGHAAGNVAELAYSLNGGALVPLSIGPDTRRLQLNGDFNVDIDYALLDGSATDDIVTIYATLDNGAVFTQDVTVQYESGHAWDKTYAIDWSTVTDIQDAVQVVDGKWSWDAGGARPEELGYDRLLVLGDQSWDNYELNVSITMHDLENEDPLGRDGGGFAIGMLWDGHTTGRFAGWQPASGYEPGASFFYTHLLKSHSYHSFSEVLGTKSMSLQEDHTYNFTVRVEQTGLYDRMYSLKVWEEGTAEPVDWTLQTIETFSLAEAPATGSIYLNAHYFDVTFGDLSVTEITGRDIIQGDDTDEFLIAVNPQDAAPGLGEIDVFVGGGGSDVFVLGDADGTYYDDLSGAGEGRGDYAFIWDFEAGEDAVQLAGVAADYLLTENHAGLTAGTAIWKAGTGTDADELIGLLNNVTGLDLNDESFVFGGVFA